jgi:hypothetical protein
LPVAHCPLPLSDEVEQFFIQTRRKIKCARKKPTPPLVNQPNRLIRNLLKAAVWKCRKESSGLFRFYFVRQRATPWLRTGYGAAPITMAETGINIWYPKAYREKSHPHDNHHAGYNRVYCTIRTSVVQNAHCRKLFQCGGQCSGCRYHSTLMIMNGLSWKLSEMGPEYTGLCEGLIARQDALKDYISIIKHPEVT